MEILTQTLVSSFMAIVIALVGLLTAKVVAYLDKRGILIELENKREIVDIVVNAMEQIWKQADGEVKLENAKKLVVEMLHEKGIKITQDELNMMIEDAVKHMNDAWENNKGVE